jgi:CRP-like cAMP-binding protein
MKQIIRFKAGDVIYKAGQTGPAFKVITGTVRLDHAQTTHQSVFANLAIAGDLVGAEVLLRKPYAFDSHALTDCEIAIWQESTILLADALAEQLIKSSWRQSDVVSLRCGMAMERILKFVKLLSNKNATEKTENLSLPPLKETADITDLTIETVCRCIASLRKQGVLVPVQGARGNLRNQFTLSIESMQAMAA